MRRRIVTAAMAAVLLLLSACGGPQSGQGTDPIALGKSLTEQAEGLPVMSVMSSDDERGEELFPYLSDLDYDKTDGYYFAYAKDGTAEEIAVIRLKDAGDAAEAKASLERHVETRLGMFRVYGPDQAPLVEDARISTAGSLVALVICGDADAVVAAFQQAAE